MDNKINMKQLMEEVDTGDVLHALQKQRNIEADVNLMLSKNKTDKYAGIKFIINEKSPQDHTEIGFFKKKIRELYQEVIELKKSNKELVENIQQLSIKNETNGSNDDLLKIINDLKKEKEKYLEDELKRIEKDKKRELDIENYKKELYEKGKNDTKDNLEKEIIVKIGENISHFFPDYESKIQNKIKEETMKNMKNEFENQFIKKLETEKEIIMKENEKKMEDYKKNIEDNHKEEFKKQLDILKNLKNNNVVESKPPVVESKPPVVEHKPVNKSNVTKAELFSLIANSRVPEPPVVETKPPVVESKPPVVESKPPVVETKPPVVESKPPVVETKPPVTITRCLPPATLLNNVSTSRTGNVSTSRTGNVSTSRTGNVSTSITGNVSTSRTGNVSTSRTGNVSTSRTGNSYKKNRRVITR